ncbi:hypothetical protein OK016_00620 [Vibrio chagasii]|nr:hypothetical protein [Vibrio chagasii]
MGTGIYFTFRLGLLQFRHLPTALKNGIQQSDKPVRVTYRFAALCTRASANLIGTGNIVGA